MPQAEWNYKEETNWHEAMHLQHETKFELVNLAYALEIEHGGNKIDRKNFDASLNYLRKM